MSESFLLCGLGNPGDAYQQTRHNLGFMLVDHLRCVFSLPEFVAKFSGMLSSGWASPFLLRLFKPMTFMNNSGVPAAQLVNFYKFDPANTLVFHDDIDLDFGRIKIKRGGGSGGHNGINSLDANLGNNYWRFRFGVGKGQADPASYVLSRFTESELVLLKEVFGFISRSIVFLLDDIASNRERFLCEYRAFLDTQV